MYLHLEVVIIKRFFDGLYALSIFIKVFFFLLYLVEIKDIAHLI